MFLGNVLGVGAGQVLAPILSGLGNATSIPLYNLTHHGINATFPMLPLNVSPDFGFMVLCALLTILHCN